MSALVTSVNAEKQSTSLPHSFQSSIPVATTPFENMSFDLIGPFDKSTNNNLHAITITDQLSKFAIAIPIQDQKEKTIMTALEQHVFLIFGPPKILLSDQGRSITSRLSKKVYESWNIKHLTTVGYNPRCNGQTEKTEPYIERRINNTMSGQKR